MPAFFLLCFIGLVIFFFLFSFLYIPLGKLVKRIFGDAIDIITTDDTQDENNEREDKKE